MRDSTADGWYVTMNGEKHGPFGRDVLKAIAKSGNLNPRIDRVWHAGMEDWVVAGEIEDLFERQEPEKAAKQAAKEEKKAAAAAASSGQGYASENEYQTNYEYQWPGVNRGGYIIAPIFFTILIGGLVAASQKFSDKIPAVASEQGPIAMVGVWVLMLLLFILQRFTNLGMSKWWFIGLLVPGLNVWLNYRLFACPPGYGPNRKMDRIGWVLAVLFWLPVVLLTGAAAWVISTEGPKFSEEMKDPEKREAFIAKYAGDGEQVEARIRALFDKSEGAEEKK